MHMANTFVLLDFHGVLVTAHQLVGCKGRRMLTGPTNASESSFPLPWVSVSVLVIVQRDWTPYARKGFCPKQMLTTHKDEHLCRITFSRTKVINHFTGWRTEADEEL